MSCLFQSLGYFMMDKNPSRLRKDICDYLESNPKMMDDLTLEQIVGLEGISNKSYVDQMRGENTWGGAIEIKAFCDLYGVNVEVIILADGKKVTFNPKKGPSEISVIITWNGNHFEPAKL